MRISHIKNISNEDIDFIEKDHCWKFNFRVYDAFTPRNEKYDDDYPDFTGNSKVKRAVKETVGWMYNFSKFFEISFSVSEKCWIDFYVKPKFI